MDFYPNIISLTHRSIFLYVSNEKFIELKTLEWDILNPDLLINLEIKNNW